MNRRKLITVAALAVLALACGETVGGMMQDAGEMLADAGDMMQPDAGAQDTPAECNKSVVYIDNEAYKRTRYWAEFDVVPGSTEVTECRTTMLFSQEGSSRDTCSRRIASWFMGTNTGFAYCGESIDWVDPDTPDTPFGPPISITVHN
jgi:hypothetical protein